MARKPRFNGDLEYYSLLFLSPAASQEEIDAAHKKLQKWLHPDTKNNDRFATQCFQLVQEAYSVLGNPDKRRFYDEFRHEKSPSVETKEESKAQDPVSEKPKKESKRIRIVFPYQVWIELESRMIPDTRRGEKVFENDSLNIFAEDSGLNFNVMFCVKTNLDEQSAYADMKMLEAHEKFFIIPGFVRDNGIFRSDIERMVEKYEADYSPRNVYSLFLVGKKACLYKIDPEKNFKPIKADHTHPGSFLKFNFSSTFEDWRYNSTAKWIKEYENYLSEHARSS